MASSPDEDVRLGGIAAEHGAPLRFDLAAMILALVTAEIGAVAMLAFAAQVVACGSPGPNQIADAS
jgi:hypothetical protein